MIKVTVALIVLFGVAVPVSAAPRKEEPYWKLPVTRDFRTKFVLFSWIGREGSYRFALIRNGGDGNQDHRFIDKFIPSQTTGITVSELEHRLAEIPRNSLVTWMKDEPHRLQYADELSRRKIMKMASRLHLDLQFNEMTYEEPNT